ncbi:hypothetical protein ACTFIR_003881 [Dictyostelium discoideum]
MYLLVKLGFKLNLEKSVLEPTQSITFSDCKSIRKLTGLKGNLIVLKGSIIPFRLYTRRTNKFHSQCLRLANGDWDQSFPIPQDVKSIVFTLVNSYKPMEWKGNKSFSKLRLCSHNRCLCCEAITELVLNNADKFSRRRPSNSASNTGEKAEALTELPKGSKVDLKKVRSSFIVYRESKGYCLNCGKLNHKVATCGE